LREEESGEILLETFKILTGIEKVDMEHFFEFSDTGYNLRGHN